MSSLPISRQVLNYSIDVLFRAHLIHDLQPYICTYENCKNPDLLYDTRQDWIQHENAHRKFFRCPEHQSSIFRTRRDIEEHLKNEHSDYGREISEILIKHASDSVASSLPDRDCPICLSSQSSLRTLQNHIALHLERFSLFSLPRSVSEIQDESEEANSNQAIDAADESRVIDFSEDRDTAESSDSSISFVDTSPEFGDSTTPAPTYGVRSQWKEVEKLKWQTIVDKKKVLDDDNDGDGGDDINPGMINSMANLTVRASDKKSFLRAMDELFEEFSDQSSTCQGTTRKGNRCKMKTSMLKKFKARNLLIAIIRKAPQPHEAAHDLLKVARLTTCYLHHEQDNYIVEYWIT